jgi:hypothetical protein
MSLQGSNTIELRKLMEQNPSIKELYEKKETWTTESLRATGYMGWVYVADVLEGKAGLADPYDVLADKAIKLTWVRKGMKDEYISVLKELPQYILVEITKVINKELGIKT